MRLPFAKTPKIGSRCIVSPVTPSQDQEDYNVDGSNQGSRGQCRDQSYSKMSVIYM